MCNATQAEAAGFRGWLQHDELATALLLAGLAKKYENFDFELL